MYGILLFYISFVVRNLLESMSKTLFFRSGEEPLILSEEQRENRKLGEYPSYVNI